MRDRPAMNSLETVYGLISSISTNSTDNAQYDVPALKAGFH